MSNRQVAEPEFSPQLVVGQDLEGKVEAPSPLVLLLRGKIVRADDETALVVAARDQLL
jgi:hypothetical protein